MNSKTFLFVFTIAACVLTAKPVFAEVDMNDPNMINDNKRLNSEQVMNAQPLTPGIPCPTGACFKDSASGYGFSQTPLIEPADQAKAGDAKAFGSGKTKK